MSGVVKAGGPIFNKACIAKGTTGGRPMIVRGSVSWVMAGHSAIFTLIMIVVSPSMAEEET
jgi:hypothetical protein